jgi:hypothetical protein
MDKLDYIDRIEAYLEGESSSEEKEAFNHALLAEPALKHAYDDYLMGKDALGLLVRDEVQERVRQVSSVGKVVPMASRFRKQWTKVAAVAVVGLLIMVSYANFQYSDQKLISDNLVPPIESGVRGEENTGILQEAKSAFFSNNYATTIELLETSSDPNALLDEGLSLLTTSYIKVDAAEKAIPILSKSLEPKNELNLAVAYLQTGEEAKCKEVLSRILADPDHGYHSEAKQLEKKLESFWKKLVF